MLAILFCDALLFLMPVPPTPRAIDQLNITLVLEPATPSQQCVPNSVIPCVLLAVSMEKVRLSQRLDADNQPEGKANMRGTRNAAHGVSMDAPEQASQQCDQHNVAACQTGTHVSNRVSARSGL